MLLTIAIPTYNRSWDLANMLKSIEAELKTTDYINIIDVLIVDNNSSDDTRMICEEYREKIKNFNYICNSENVGIVGNMYNCITFSGGEYIWTIGDDETILEGGINRVINSIINFKDDIYIFNYSSEPNLEQDKFLLTNFGRIVENKQSTLIEIVNDYGWLWCLGNLGMVVAKKKYLLNIDFNSYSTCSFAQASWYLESFVNLKANFVNSPIFRTYVRSQTVNKERWKTDGTLASFVNVKKSVSVLVSKGVIKERMPLNFFNGCSQDRFPIWCYIVRLINEEIRGNNFDINEEYWMALIELVSRLEDAVLRESILKNIYKIMCQLTILDREKKRSNEMLKELQNKYADEVSNFISSWNVFNQTAIGFDLNN